MQKILVVENEEIQTKVIDKIINNINCETIFAERGREGLEIINNRKDEIGLIILDLALPDIGGLEILQELNNSKNKIPVAILSVTEDVATVVEAMKLGADNFFVKFKDNKELLRLYEYIGEKIHPDLS